MACAPQTNYSSTLFGALGNILAGDLEVTWDVSSKPFRVFGVIVLAVHVAGVVCGHHL